MLKFDWDEANSAHIADHGVTCDEAEQVLANQPIDLDYQNRNSEERLLQIGETLAGRILAVASVVRGSKVRVITAFEPRKAIKRQYFVERAKLYGTNP
jgi:uncharacterized DUF497 family protein